MLEIHLSLVSIICGFVLVGKCCEEKSEEKN